MEKNVILIADDVEINRTMLSFIFEEQYEILEAADGARGIAIMRGNHRAVRKTSRYAVSDFS